MLDVYKRQVLNIPLDTTQTQEGPGYGAALLAMVACGRFSNVQQAAQTLVRVKATVLPQPGLAEKYEQRYAQFRQIYPCLLYTSFSISGVITTKPRRASSRPYWA